MIIKIASKPAIYSYPRTAFSSKSGIIIFFLIMGTTGLLAMVNGGAPMVQRHQKQFFNSLLSQRSPFRPCLWRVRHFSARSSLLPPDVPRLAETARITLTPNEVEEFAPKIQQVIDWFGQLQAVDLQSVEPALRAESESGNLREDLPETFDNRDSMLAAVPNYEEPYIKVPKVLNKD